MRQENPGPRNLKSPVPDRASVRHPFPASTARVLLDLLEEAFERIPTADQPTHWIRFRPIRGDPPTHDGRSYMLMSIPWQQPPQDRSGDEGVRACRPRSDADGPPRSDRRCRDRGRSRGSGRRSAGGGCGACGRLRSDILRHGSRRFPVIGGGLPLSRPLRIRLRSVCAALEP